MTDGGALAFVPTVALCDVALFATRLFAAAAVPDALKVIGLPARLVTDAETVLLLVPAVCPRVHDVSVATPEAFVTTDAGLAGLMAPPVPPVAVNVNVTDTPCTGLLYVSRTTTEGGAATAVFTVALCDVTLFAIMFCAGPA